MSERARPSMGSGLLRIAVGLSIVLAMACAGFVHRSPWTVVLAAPLFTVLYALGKWNAWQLAWRLGGAKRIALAALATLPIQAVLAAVFYLLGLGLSMLLAPAAPIAALDASDFRAAGVLFLLAVAASALIIRLEAAQVEVEATAPAGPDSVPAAPAGASEIELDIDPSPLSIENFFPASGHGACHAAVQALEGRETGIEKPPFAASEAMIAATEARLGVRLPETLRRLYGVKNGGYVGDMYVARKPDARPVYDDWRGAFAIDYSSLAPLEDLRTVAEHYDDFTHDPEDLPAHADRRIVLQARYGDMTLLDYAGGAEPRVLIVDYGKHGDADPVDIAFETFDGFFAALRRERAAPPWTPAPDAYGPPLREAPEEVRARMFWGEAGPHPFRVMALQREDGSEPMAAADDALIARTEARLGLRLPASLRELWRVKNGGGVSCRFAGSIDADGAWSPVEAMRYPVPLEHVVTLATLSDRLLFPPGETPWKNQFAEPERLVVLDAERARLLLLDYRGRADDDPAVRVVGGLERSMLHEVLHLARFDELLARLRPQLRGFEDVAQPWTPAPRAQEPADA